MGVFDDSNSDQWRSIATARSCRDDIDEHFAIVAGRLPRQANRHFVTGRFSGKGPFSACKPNQRMKKEDRFPKGEKPEPEQVSPAQMGEFMREH